MLLNVATHNVSKWNVKVSKRERHITYSVTKHSASQNVKYVSITKRFITVYVLWRCTLCDVYDLKTFRFGTLTLCEATFCNIMWMRSSLVWMRSSLVWMRSSLVVRASDCQCTSCNGPGFDPSIRRHSGIWGAADEAVLNIGRTKKEKKKSPLKILNITSCDVYVMLLYFM